MHNREILYSFVYLYIFLFQFRFLNIKLVFYILICTEIVFLLYLGGFPCALLLFEYSDNT